MGTGCLVVQTTFRAAMFLALSAVIDTVNLNNIYLLIIRPVLWIRIHFIRIRILDPDLGPGFLETVFTIKKKKYLKWIFLSGLLANISQQVLRLPIKIYWYLLIALQLV